MNILITGGLGYLGGRIADYLKTKEPHINIFLATRDIKNIPLWTKRFTVLQMNLLDEKSISKCLVDSAADIIIHLAALNEIDSAQNPELAHRVNTEGTRKLLEFALKEGIKKFIYFSTFHVYDKSCGPFISEKTPTHPFRPYATTHFAAERIVESFRDKGIDTLIFRLSNGYGYPMDKDINRWTLVVNDLCRQAVVTHNIILKSSGRQCRDFITLHDVARAVHHFLSVIPDSWGDGLYNLGCGQSISVLEMAKRIAELYQKKYGSGEVEIKKKIGDDNFNTESFTFNIDKLKNTGFQLEGNMENEIMRTMNVSEKFLEDPLVSVIMPTYNHAQFIGDAVTSVLNQSYYNIELVIVDNYSQDSTEDIVKSFFDPRVKYYKFSNNGIIAASRNFGIRKSKGEFVAFLDSDDMWFGDKLVIQMKCMKESPEVSLVSCSLRIKSTNKNYDGKVFPGNEKTQTNNFYKRLQDFNFIAASSVLINKNALNNIGYFDEDPEIVSAEDWDLWLRIARKYRIAITAETLGVYRMHSLNQIKDYRRLQRALRVVNKHLREGWITQSQADRTTAILFLREGWFCSTSDIRIFRSSFREALNFSKGDIRIYCISLVGLLLSVFPFLCSFIQKKSLCRKIANVFFNS